MAWAELHVVSSLSDLFWESKPNFHSRRALEGHQCFIAFLKGAVSGATQLADPGLRGELRFRGY